MNREEFLQQKTIQRMLTGLRDRRGGNKSKSTEKGFLYYIRRYCMFYAKATERAFASPDQIIQERRADMHSEDEEIEHRHETLVKEFGNMLSQEERCPHCRIIAVGTDTKTRIKKCKRCGKTIPESEATGEKPASGTVAFAKTAVKAFYRENYRKLELGSTPFNTETEYKKPTRDEWQLVMEIVREEMKDDELATYILCNKDSGMSPGDLLLMTGKEGSQHFGSITDQLRKGTVPIHIRTIREKTKAKGIGFYDSFFGDESAEALAEYLSSSHSRRFFSMAQRTVEDHFSTIAQRINAKLAARERKGEVVIRWSHFTPKSCRKWFNGQLKFAKVSLKPEQVMGANLIIEYMMGHSIKGQQAAYIIEKFRDEPGELRDIYGQGYYSIRFWES